MHGNSFQYFPLWLTMAGGLPQDLSGDLQHRFTWDVSSSKALHQPGTQDKSLQWKLNLSFALCIFCPCFGFVFSSFLPLQLSRQHLGVLWNKCYPLKAHHCLPERKMASYWKQYVMVIAVFLQVMPLKNVRDLFSSNWWWGKAQLKRKLTIALSFTQLQTPSYKCLVVFIAVFAVASRTRNNTFPWCFCWSHK